MKALRHHCKIRWVLLYMERWLKAPLQYNDGELVQRDMGTPQGGVVSPLLANLFLHYGFDAWARRILPRVPFCRYADDGLLHCRSRRQAEYVMARIARRFKECGLEIHPEKSRIVYCKVPIARKPTKTPVSTFWASRFVHGGVYPNLMVFIRIFCRGSADHP